MPRSFPSVSPALRRPVACLAAAGFLACAPIAPLFAQSGSPQSLSAPAYGQEFQTPQGGTYATPTTPSYNAPTGTPSYAAPPGGMAQPIEDMPVREIGTPAVNTPPPEGPAPVTDQTRMVAPDASESAADARATILSAEATLTRMTSTTGFKDQLKTLIRRSRAVLIIPSFYKAGFLVGGAYGHGVLLVRSSDGSFSDPAFYRLTAGSFGFQFGVQDNQVVMAIMTEAGLKAVMEDQFKGGATASVSFFMVGAGAEASTTTDVGEDIYAFSQSVGLFGGAGLEGTKIEPRQSWNMAVYGAGTTVRNVLFDRRVSTPLAANLKHLLAKQ
ncbi:lipid-binding SYLF domain-containing protein [Rhodospirillum rubrum]|uniref:Ysc84 actin-binding domain-containing protein n=1 Tax=Rhodospirillum rubrum (strain ATCC 11170 / ATH 1.1.1 / DSM 467 / LMG 4362 / NCIMB 8255 / S1) TaxID=269796 RepID=Q2RNX1_RHORT|nr:lipid-binding SYLF domain-containing protein [Rhodospirillum rubrum]ABC24174.1 conserved hypothetical protein [Rhodospirillum rubrum ATCC 11170]AEO49925.1 hypothetical protein F11_17325 [Rhodospirillum rubrum F11]MBK5955887.1 hypothetical protein [Rhodospirillum rubrum]QXG80111.1 hypothetical protein KUL73_17460 [Rhodospirillum rubrum]HAQ00021.1 hypothetical protein [Rhodospirillum rubrum]